MRVACNDGYIRRFYPAQGIGTHLKVSLAHISAAYCEECGKQFRIVPTPEQIEEWKAHVCNTARLKKFVPKDDKEQDNSTR